MTMTEARKASKAQKKLSEWIESQIGPGRRFRSRREFGLSMGWGEHLAQQVIDRGTAKVETLFDLARGCDVPPWFVISLAAGMDVEAPKTSGCSHSADEQVLLEAFRRYPATHRQQVIDLIALGAMNNGESRELDAQQ